MDLWAVARSWAAAAESRTDSLVLIELGKGKHRSFEGVTQAPKYVFMDFWTDCCLLFVFFYCKIHPCVIFNHCPQRYQGSRTLAFWGSPEIEEKTSTKGSRPSSMASACWANPPVGGSHVCGFFDGFQSSLRLHVVIFGCWPVWSLKGRILIMVRSLQDTNSGVGKKFSSFSKLWSCPWKNLATLWPPKWPIILPL